jgi:hypothetical protein
VSRGLDLCTGWLWTNRYEVGAIHTVRAGHVRGQEVISQ